MSERMIKELVINALNDAYLRAGRPTGVILHSNRGFQYCSNNYLTPEEYYNEALKKQKQHRNVQYYDVRPPFE